MIQFAISLVALTMTLNAHASMAADTSLDGSLVNCTTAGVEPFRSHNGGYQFRLDEVPERRLMAHGHFWEVTPGHGDMLLKRDLGREFLNVIPHHASTGDCLLLVNQVNDRDNNQMDIRIRINREDPRHSMGSMRMVLEGQQISPEHGRLACTIDPSFAAFFAKRHCDDPGPSSPRYHSESTTSSAR